MSLEDKKADFLIAEWNSLRNEIINRNNQRDGYIKIAWTGVFAILTIALGSKQYVAILFTPIIFSIFILQVIRSYQVHFRISNYIQEELENQIGDYLDLEESEKYVSYYRRIYNPGRPRGDYINIMTYLSLFSITLFFVYEKNTNVGYIIYPATAALGYICLIHYINKENKKIELKSPKL